MPCSLLLAFASIIGQGPSPSSAPVKALPYHLTTTFTQKVRADLTVAMDVSETRDGVVNQLALIPPNTETQRLVTCRLTCRELPQMEAVEIGDLHDASRRFKMLSIPLSAEGGRKTLHFDIEYVVEMYKCVLAPGTGRPPSPLTADEESRDLAATPYFDYKDPRFQGYLANNALLKRPDESNAAFAYRAYGILAAEICARTTSQSEGTPVDKWRSSFMSSPECHDQGCGNCSNLFVSVMRANGVPSRTLAGRWALNEANGYGQWHVRSDFFDPAMGWVLVDQTFAVNSTRDHMANPLQNFGGPNPDFIVMHTNSEVHPKGINFEMPVHQFGITSYAGRSVWNPRFTETWTVRKL